MTTEQDNGVLVRVKDLEERILFIFPNNLLNDGLSQVRIIRGQRITGKPFKGWRERKAVNILINGGGVRNIFICGEMVSIYRSRGCFNGCFDLSHLKKSLASAIRFYLGQDVDVTFKPCYGSSLCYKCGIHCGSAELR